MKTPFFLFLALCAGIGARAQEYTFSLSSSKYTILEQSTMDNGAQLITFPAGADLNNAGLVYTVPEGATVSPTAEQARLRDYEIEFFTVTYADGTVKTFPYYFTAGRWFTAILFGDPEINLTDRTNNYATPANLTKWANGIINMKGSGRYAFATNPKVKPAPDLVICMGDMDQDNEKSGDDIKAIFNLFTAQNIPFLTMCGNHDLVPDYFSGETGDAGLTYGIGTEGGMNSNKLALSIVESYSSTAASNGIENLKTFTQSNGKVQIQPYTFTFKGVRFYIGQTYWFQKPYNNPYYSLIPYKKYDAVYYSPNGIISSLTEFVEANKETPSVWVQHYPISCEDRWWLDQNDVGRSIAPTDTPDYATATAKREKYLDLISKTKNPYHFSGHNHAQSIVTHSANGTAFRDYISPYFATKGGAWMVLCHEGEGVKEVQSVDFDYE